MTADPRAALAMLVSAFERHLELASSRQDPDDPAVLDASDALVEALEDYDEALFAATGVDLPIGDEDDFDEDDDADDDSDSDDDEDDGDDGDDDADDDADDVDGVEVDDHTDEDGDATVYAGLDDEEIDFEDGRG